MRELIIAANWKMNTTPATASLSRRNRRQNNWLGLRPTTCLLGSPPASGPTGSTTIGSLAAANVEYAGKREDGRLAPASARLVPPGSFEQRRRLRVGIPRMLNIWSTAPFWRTYFETLGIQRQNVVFSDETTEEMWVEGGKYGSVDPCYPSKVGQAHVHNLTAEQLWTRPNGAARWANARIVNSPI